MYDLVLFLSAVFFAAFCFFFARSRAFNIYNPLTLYAAFHFFIFVLRPIFARAFDYSSIYGAYRFMPSESDKITVILAANLGFAAFAVASLIRGNVSVDFRRNAEQLREQLELKRVFLWVCLLLGPYAGYSVLRNIQDMTQGQYIAGMVLDRMTGVSINTKTSGYVTDAQIMFATLSAIFAWLNRFKPASLIPLLIFCVFRATTGTRLFFIFALVMAALFYAFEKRVLRPSPRILVLVACVVFTFQFVGADRGARVRDLVGTYNQERTAAATAPKLRFMESMDYANMEFFEYLVWVIPKQSGTYDYFLDNFQVLTEPIPRILWKGKPVGEPFRRISLFEYGFPIGMTRSLPGEGWYALGWLGVAMWCGLWGFVTGSIYRGFARGPKTTLRITSYVVFETMLIAFYRDGQLLTLVKILGVFLAPCLVWLWVGKMANVEWAKIAALPKAQGEAGRQPARAAPEAALPPAVARRRRALAMSGSTGPE